MTPKDCLSLSLCVSGVSPLLDSFHSRAVGINGDDLIGVLILLIMNFILLLFIVLEIK